MASKYKLWFDRLPERQKNVVRESKNKYQKLRRIKFRNEINEYQRIRRARLRIRKAHCIRVHCHSKSGERQDYALKFKCTREKIESKDLNYCLYCGSPINLENDERIKNLAKGILCKEHRFKLLHAVRGGTEQPIRNFIGKSGISPYHDEAVYLLVLIALQGKWHTAVKRLNTLLKTGRTSLKD